MSFINVYNHVTNAAIQIQNYSSSLSIPHPNIIPDTDSDTANV